MQRPNQLLQGFWQTFIYPFIKTLFKRLESACFCQLTVALWHILLDFHQKMLKVFQGEVVVTSTNITCQPPRCAHQTAN